MTSETVEDTKVEPEVSAEEGSSATLAPEDNKVGLTGEVLTDQQRIENLELILAKFIPSVEKVLGTYRDEIIKTQKFVLMSLEKGTKNQKKLLTPPQYRKPHIRNEEQTVGESEHTSELLVDNQGEPLTSPHVLT